MIMQFLPDNLKIYWARFYFNDNRRRRFYNKVAELYDNGVKIDDILNSLKKRAAKDKPNGTDVWIYNQIILGLSGSGLLSNGTKQFLPVIDNILIKAGETSGNLSKTLLTAAEMNAKNQKMKGLIRKALSYPVFLLILTIAAICLFGATLFPAMEDFVSIDKWPQVSKMMYGISKFFISWYFVVVILLIGLGYLLRWSFSNFTGSFRIRLDKFPPWSLYRLTQGGAWIMSIASMVSSGILNIEALQIIREESKKNKWLRERTLAVEDNINRSQSMGIALSTKFDFPDREVVEDMADYASSANFNEIFEKVGKEWIDMSVENVETQAKILNNVALLLVMSIIAVLVQAIFSLIMSFMTNFQTSAM